MVLWFFSPFLFSGGFNVGTIKTTWYLQFTLEPLSGEPKVIEKSLGYGGEDQGLAESLACDVLRDVDKELARTLAIISGIFLVRKTEFNPKKKENKGAN